MEHPDDAGRGTVAEPDWDPSWASEQVDYLLSGQMDSALSRRDDADPMRVEVAQSLSTLAGMLLDKGAVLEARRACDAAVAHLRIVRDAGGEVTRDLDSALVNLGIVCWQAQEDGSETDRVDLVYTVAEVAWCAAEALRLILSSRAPDDGADLDVLLSAASLAARAQADLAPVDTQLIADVVAAAQRCAQPDATSTETLRALGFDLTLLTRRLAERDLPLDATQAADAAAAVYRTLAAREPERYGPDLAIALKNCAVISDRLGRSRQAARDAQGASQWYGRRSERGEPREVARAAMLMLEARSWLAAGAYGEAERPAREAQQIYGRFAEADPAQHAGAQQSAHSLVELARTGAN